MHTLRRFGALAVVAGALALMPAVRAEIIEQILVKVNGEILTKTDFETRQVNALRQRGQQQLSDEQLKKAIAEITPQLLVDTIDEMLLEQKGRSLGYKLDDNAFSQIIGNIKKENKIENDEQFQAALRQEGLTMADLRKMLERNMLITKVQQDEIMAHISISDEEARAYYGQHASDFTSPATLTLREIFISVPGDGRTVNVGLDEDAKAKADAARGRAIAGEPFEKLVAEFSDAPSKANGGLVGPITEDELDPALKKLLDPLKVGGVTDVVRTQRGYQILKLETKSDRTLLSFDKARDQIADIIGNSKSQGEMQKYVRKLRAEAIIDWKNAELKKLYEQQVAAKPAVPGGA